jgi:hypothetical protein
MGIRHARNPLFRPPFTGRNLAGKTINPTINLYVNYYHHQRPNSKFNGGCIIEGQTQWHEDGIINQIESIPGLLNYYYRTPETQKV